MIELNRIYPGDVLVINGDEYEVVTNTALSKGDTETEMTIECSRPGDKAPIICVRYDRQHPKQVKELVRYKASTKSWVHEKVETLDYKEYDDSF